MSEKRRWWRADERFRKVHDNLRKNYDEALRREKEKMAAQLAEEKAKYDTRAKDLWLAHDRALKQEREMSARLAREITRCRFEFGPSQFGSRFSLYVTMEERFMMGANDLKEMSHYIIDMLCASLKREFAQIDFGRAKAVPPQWAQRMDPPRFTLDPFSDESKLR